MKIDCSFIIAVNDKGVLQNTFLSSPALDCLGRMEVLLKEEIPSASKAYNHGIEEARNDLLIFVHQDIFLPETWPADLSNALDFLERHDGNWGVLGCFGKTQDGRGWGNLYSTGLQRFVGEPFGEPREVQTLDEIVLIIRKSSGLRFDENLPHFHFYGSDICLAAGKKEMRSYAIDAFCIHNSNPVVRLPKEFFECYRYIKKKYKEFLPVQTSCIRITRTDLEYHRYKAIQSLSRLRKVKKSNARAEDILAMWKELKGSKRK